jgi:hypothetical protein
MAAGFWYLEDGRCFLRRFSRMSYMLKQIVSELYTVSEAHGFAVYLDGFVLKENDEPNGYGGFYNRLTGESVMQVFDLREFTNNNQIQFWNALQRVITKLKAIKTPEADEQSILFIMLMDMHKSICKGEPPELLNHCIEVKPKSNKKLGPDWEKKE